MALTGLEIFKLLPKTNCGDCNVPTCLAFAMKLAQKKAELSECPHTSEEAKRILGAASEPPMRLVKIGLGADAFEIGGETELFRHEKKFYHQTAIFIRIDASETSESVAQKVSQADDYVIERVGERMFIQGFYLHNNSTPREHYLAALDALLAHTSKAVILDIDAAETVKAALTKVDGKRLILYPRCDVSSLVTLANECGAALILPGASFDDLAVQVEKITATGFKNFILNMAASTKAMTLQNHTILRRAALRKGFKPFGFPVCCFIESEAESQVLADAIVNICKYSNLVVLPYFNKEMMLSLYALRQNIYTDPQKPIQVDAKLYAIGEPRPESPIFVTTNFSLTYFIVSGEIENADISAWLVIPDCEGMSVLTAWAAGKFSGDKVGKFVKSIGLEKYVTRMEIIIPGYVASISGELEEALPGWRVVVGPQEAADLGPFIKNYVADRAIK
jgi:acetyl-CoA decarbonylase/synthase complex subunit gamma